MNHFLENIEMMYGVTDPEEIKEKLGKPTIELDMGDICYLEHTFDGIHIFTLEYVGNNIDKLSYFSVDG